jgi:chromosome segregation ATPase
MKQLGVFICFALVAVATVPADEGQLPYVDIDAANARIASLQQTNEAYRQEITEKTQTNSSLEGDIASWQQEILEIDPILQRVNAELTDLFDVNRTIVDEAMKGRSQEAIGRARTIKRGLENQIRSLNSKVTTAQNQMEENRTRMRILNNRIANNEEESAYLQAAIAQTQAQQERLETYIVNVDSILSDAEQYLDQASEESE